MIYTYFPLAKSAARPNGRLNSFCQRSQHDSYFFKLFTGICLSLAFFASTQTAQSQTLSVTITPQSATYAEGQSVTLTFSGGTDARKYNVFMYTNSSYSSNFTSDITVSAPGPGGSGNTITWTNQSSAYFVVTFKNGSSGSPRIFHIVAQDEDNNGRPVDNSSDYGNSSSFSIIIAPIPCTSPSLSIAATPSLTVINGTSVTLTASGANSYLWSANAGSVTSSSAVVNAPGIYSVTGTSGTCTNSTSVEVVNKPPTLSLSIDPVSTTYTEGQSVTLTFSGGLDDHIYTLGMYTDNTYTTNFTSDITVSAPGPGGSGNTIAWSSQSSAYFVVTFKNESAGSPRIFHVVAQDEGVGGRRLVSPDYGDSNSFTIVAPCSPPSLSVMANPSLAVTSGTNVTLTASGADSYLWSANAGSVTSNSVVVSIADVYSVTGTSGTCTSSTSVVVQDCGVPIIADATSLTVSQPLGPNNCSVALKGTGYGTGYTITGPNGYVFSAVYRRVGSYTINGLSVTEPGTYTLMVSYADACGRSNSDTMTYVVTGEACQ